MNASITQTDTLYFTSTATVIFQAITRLPFNSAPVCPFETACFSSAQGSYSIPQINFSDGGGNFYQCPANTPPDDYYSSCYDDLEEYRLPTLLTLPVGTYSVVFSLTLTGLTGNELPVTNSLGLDIYVQGGAVSLASDIPEPSTFVLSGSIALLLYYPLRLRS